MSVELHIVLFSHRISSAICSRTAVKEVFEPHKGMNSPLVAQMVTLDESFVAIEGFKKIFAPGISYVRRYVCTHT